MEDRLVLSADGLPAITGATFAPEGSVYTLQLDSAGRNVASWTVNWGDGAVVTLAGTATSTSHTYADGPAGYTITAKATEQSPLSLTQWAAAAGGNDHYYALTSGVQTWTQAEAEAAALGGHLVSITSAQEQAFVVNTFLAGNNDRRILWMGLNDAAVEGTFVWSSGEAVAYTNFQSGEPNNYLGVEDYGALNWHYGNRISGGVKGSWNDTPLNGFNASASAPLPCVGVMEFNTAPAGPETVRTLQVHVDNVAPTAGISGPGGGSEGQTLTYTLTAADPSAGDRAAGFTFAIDWDGDGVTDQTVSGPSGTSVSHVFAESGYYTVHVTATDRDGAVSSQTSLSVDVPNVAPTAGVSGPASGSEGEALAFTLSASDTPGDMAAGFTFAIDWDGDGVTDQTVSGQSGLVVEHAFSDSGPYTVYVTAVDRDGGVSTAASLPLTVLNVAPTAGLSPSSGTEGEPLSFTLTAFDPSPGDMATGFTFAIDWDGDGTADQTVTGLSGTAVEHTFSESGSYSVNVTATDRDGDTGAQAPFTIDILNVAPTAGVSGPTSGHEGDTLSFTLTASDVSAGDQAAGFTFAIDWDGDGVTDQTVVGQSGLAVSHLFAESGASNVLVSATDRDGGTGAQTSLTVDIQNVAPTAGVSGPASGSEGEALTFTLSASDTPGDQAAGFTFAIDWDGDGVTDQTVSGQSGIAVAHTFSESGPYAVYVTAADRDGGVSTAASHSLSVLNVAPTAGVSGPASGREGDSLSFTLTASDVSPGDQSADFTFAIDWDGDGVTDQTVVGQSGLAVSHLFAESGASNVLVSATDRDGGTGAQTSLTVDIQNVAPTAGISGPASGRPGETLSFTLTASDPSCGDRAAGFSYAIDWDGDGVTDQTVFGASGTSVSHAFAQSGAYNVRVSATDRDGAAGPQASLAVNVLSVASTAGISGPSSGVRGQTLAFTLTASGASAGQAGYTFAIDWNGDGVTDQTVVGQSGLVVEHAFAQSGNYNVRVTARGPGGDTSPAVTRQVNVSTAALQADPLDASRTVLVVGGTAGNDIMIFDRTGDGGVRVWVNGRDEGTFKPTGGVYGYGYGGNDVLFALTTRGTMNLFGGAGNDFLVAGGGGGVLCGGDGDDVLLGGPGDDVLSGGNGNDVLRGGGGHDVLFGGGGSDLFACSQNDLIVTGSTAFDNNVEALSAVSAEWKSPRGRDVREKNLRDGSGSATRRNGNVFLNEDTVLSDNVADHVFAHLGRGNLVYFSGEDRVLRGPR